MQLVISFGKICIYRLQRVNLGKLAMNLERRLARLDEDSKEIIYFENYMKLASSVCFGFSGLLAMLGIAYLASPLFVEKRVLPFDVWYPWNWENSDVLYITSYVHEIVIVIVLSCTDGAEFSYVWSTIYCCARLKMINQKLKTLCYNTNKKNDSEYLSFIVKYHVCTLR